MLNRNFWSLLTIAFLFGCQQEPILEITPVAEPEPEVRSFPGVDEELWTYFAAFEDAGRQQGMTVDLVAARITATIGPIGEDRVAGQCTYNSHRPNTVLIDEDFWERAGTFGREFVVFHELGHCFLVRDHREDQHDNGRCVSLMRSGAESCWDAYNRTTRGEYLEELFSITNDWLD